MKYPLSKEEYEKKIYELFKETPSDLSSQEKTELLTEFLEEDPQFIERAYGASKSLYNQNYKTWQQLGLTEQEMINRFMSYPIHNLRLILELD